MARRDLVGRDLLPPIETIRSPACSPIAAAGVSATTSSTVDITLPAVVMNSTVKSAIARTMLAPGPAAIATTRFHVAARQYASGPSASPMSSRPRSAARAACSESCSSATNSRSASSASRGGVVVSFRQRAAQAAHRAAQRGMLLERPAEGSVDVGRRRPVHAGDLHEATERDRADAVLDPASRRLGDGGREADVEPPRAHAERQRRDEVAQLVHEDEHAEPDDGEEDGHAGVSLRPAARRASASAATGRRGRARALPRRRRACPRRSLRCRGTRSCPARNASTATSFAAL